MSDSSSESPELSPVRTCGITGCASSGSAEVAMCEACLAVLSGDGGTPESRERVLRGAMTGDSEMDSVLLRCFEVLRLKGRDYTVGSEDRMANFNRASDFFGVRPEQALGIYFHKHVSAIYNYILSGGQSESEPIRERIVDCVNYMLLLAHMISKKPSG